MRRRRAARQSEQLPTVRDAAELAKVLKADRKLAEAHIRCYGEFEDIRTISTGISTLDGVCGGGVPRSRFAVFSGKEGGGKTSAALCTAASFQRKGGIVLYADPERKLDYGWAAHNGVNLEQLIVTRPSTIEKGFETAEKAIRVCDPEVPFLYVLDSVNASITKKQREAEYGAEFYAPQPRAFSEALPKIVEHLENSGATFLMISQLRAKMDATTTIAGGNAVRFYSVLIVTFTPGGKLTRSGKKVWDARKEGIEPGSLLVTGQECRIQTIKNQISPPFQESMIRIDFRSGIDRPWCVLHRAEELGLIKAAGSWQKFKEVKWQGPRGFERILKKRPKLLNAMRKAIRRAQ